MLYAEDHDGFHVAVTGHSVDYPSLTSSSWEAPLSIYLGIDWAMDGGIYRGINVGHTAGGLDSTDVEVFVCPSDPTDPGPSHLKKSYGVNTKLNANESDHSFGVVSRLTADKNNTMDMIVHDSEINLPSRTIISGELWGDTNSGSGYQPNRCGSPAEENNMHRNMIRQYFIDESRDKEYYYDVHEGMGLSNFLFADGHVTSMLYREVVSENGASYDKAESMLSRDQ